MTLNFLLFFVDMSLSQSFDLIITFRSSSSLSSPPSFFSLVHPIQSISHIVACNHIPWAVSLFSRQIYIQNHNKFNRCHPQRCTTKHTLPTNEQRNRINFFLSLYENIRLIHHSDLMQSLPTLARFSYLN